MEASVDAVTQAREAASEKLKTLRQDLADHVSMVMNPFHIEKSREQARIGLRQAREAVDSYSATVAQAESDHAAALQAANQILDSGTVLEGLLSHGLEGETDEVVMQNLINRALVGYQSYLRAADEAYIAAVRQ